MLFIILGLVVRFTVNGLIRGNIRIVAWHGFEYSPNTVNDELKRADISVNIGSIK